MEEQNERNTAALPSDNAQPLFLARFCAAWVYTGRRWHNVSIYASFPVPGEETVHLFAST
jgi:hypothetical protein